MSGEAAPSSSSAITPSELSLILHLKIHHWGGERNNKLTFFVVFFACGAQSRSRLSTQAPLGTWEVGGTLGGVGEHSLTAPCTTPQNALNEAFNPTSSRATGAGHRGEGGDAGRRRWRWSEQQQVSQGPHTSVTLLLLLFLLFWSLLSHHAAATRPISPQPRALLGTLQVAVQQQVVPRP